MFYPQVANLERGISHLQRRQSIYGLSVVVAVALLAAVFTAQGWRSRIVSFDLVPDLYQAHAFLATGTLPSHGDVGSYGSFAPPGPALLMLPSVALFHDPRLSQYIGAGLLHLVTLLGVFLLARKYFGTWCAILAVVLYGLSAQGLFWAGSLWPIGSPDMVFWLVYLASEWVTRRDGRFLGVAVLAWALGMYLDLAIAPAILVLPVIWLLYRPPVTLKPLLAAAGVLLIVWFPYLRFEAGRDFADLRSQFLLEYIVPPNVSESWCDPARSLRALPLNTPTTKSSADARGQPQPGVIPVAGSGDSPSARLNEAFRDRLLGNFSSITLPGSAVIRIALLASVLATAVLLGVTGCAPTAGKAEHESASAVKMRWLTLPERLPSLAVGVVLLALAVGLLGVGFERRAVLFDPRLPALVRGALAILLLGGTLLLTLRFATAIVDRLLKRRGVRVQSGEDVRRRRLVVVALAVPWLFLIAVAEPGNPGRFLWLWPLQVLFVAIFVSVLLPRLRVPRLVVLALQALVAFVFIWNAFLVSRVDDWRSSGWSGKDAAEARVVDYIAADLQTDGRERAAIGYQVFFYPFMAKYNALSAYYKVGAEFDALFKYGHGIQNMDTCAEGVSPSDRYRIVQTRPISGQDAPRHYFRVPLDDRFKLVRTIGVYEIFKATREATAP
jgi:hypothetical protein